jgi:hypothetical protein
LRFPRNLKYVVNSSPNADHSNRLHGSRIIGVQNPNAILKYFAAAF